MFKCCMSKHSSRTSTESDSDDTPSQSRKLPIDDSKVDDKTEILSTANNVHNNIQKVGVIPETTLSSLIRDETVTFSCSLHEQEDKKDNDTDDKSNIEHSAKEEETSTKVIKEMANKLEEKFDRVLNILEKINEEIGKKTIEETTDKAAEKNDVNIDDTDRNSNLTKEENAVDECDEIKEKSNIIKTQTDLSLESSKKLDVIKISSSDTDPIVVDIDKSDNGDLVGSQINQILSDNNTICTNEIFEHTSENIENINNVEPKTKNDELISNSNECNAINEVQSTGSGIETHKEEYLEQLVNRLENATIRLEKVSTHYPEQTNVGVQIPSPKKSKSQAESSSKHSSDPSVNMSVDGYKELLAGPVQEYLDLSQKIGGDVAAHSKLVEKAFQFQLQFMQAVASRASPANQSEHIALLEPMSGQIQKIQEFREKNRGSSFFNHLSAISESIPALGWVAVTPTPAPYVKEMNDAGQFYTNRVLKDWKEKDKIHIDWCKAWVQTLTDLQKYVRQYHTTGLVWGKTGAAPIGIPPPPPPSMPIGDIAPLMVNDDRSALFAQINQGEDITKNLKKVTSDMQTHKNPSLRSGPAPFKAPVVTSAMLTKSVVPANAPIDKPPVFTRDGKKWLVEYHKGGDLMIDNVEMNNVVYMFRCHDSTLTIKGKLNSVVIDSCRKSYVVFDSLVSSIEFVNCQSVQMQVLGKVPTISIDKTDGCQVYLSNESLEVEIISSKSSEMNIMVPKGNGDYTEYPVPEQFKTTISKNGLSTLAVDSLG